MVDWWINSKFVFDKDNTTKKGKVKNCAKKKKKKWNLASICLNFSRAYMASRKWEDY